MNTETETTDSGRNTSGLRPWRKGQSGNPLGRRAKGLATAERLRNALVKELPQILKTVVENAKKGDITAAKTILERVLPPLKAIETPAAFKGLTGTLSDQGQGILQAMAAGVIAPGQAAQLLGAIAAQAKILEVDAFAKRLDALERRLGAANGQP
jgi:Family of unknown function (DUF5681)